MVGCRSIRPERLVKSLEGFMKAAYAYTQEALGVATFK